jgi:F420H(2)-dependent quinone reductase
MSVDSDYEPSPRPWVRKQVETFEESNGTKANELRNLPIVVMTMRGAQTGKTRKVPVMRVEHDGHYAAVASLGGAPTNPVWYYNLVADPLVRLQDGGMQRLYTAREVHGDEKAQWWERAVAAYPDYADYQKKTTRIIPVFVLEPTE